MDETTKKVLIAGVGAVVAAKLLDNKTQIFYDLSVLKRAGYLKKEGVVFAQQKTQIADVWADTVAKYPNKDCIVFEDQKLSFRDVDLASNKIANWAVKKGFKPGSCIALNMENRPEYIICWLGLTKAGIAIALLNYNIKLKALEHSIKVAHSVGVLFGPEINENMSEVIDSLSAQNIPSFCLAGVTEASNKTLIPGAHSIDAEWASLPDTPVNPSIRAGLGGIGLFGYIYTSGTTGLPKACRITHAKYNSFGNLFPVFFCGRPEDRLYTCLPLYHSAGGGLAAGAMVKHGVTLVLARKFSARRFWIDCVKYRATAIQYIGELCRYLLASPFVPEEKQHLVRIAFGNGLRPEIWNEFQRRFGIIEIGEFYGATEGNGALFNLCRNYQGQGAVGRSGSLTRAAIGTAIVKFNVETEEPIRAANGRCIPCGADETGELVFRIDDEGSNRFEGYSDKNATKKKILENVFKEGDRYFRTGDLLKQDSKGYFYFVDRIGDTFRWKGENVSTMEVSEVLSAHPSITEANVYGVSIPGHDGRACMVAVVTKAELDPKEFSAYCKKHLPSYSVPMFVRFLTEVDITGTFKHKKVELRNEGFADTKGDRVWEFVGGEQGYKLLEPARAAALAAGSAKL